MVASVTVWLPRANPVRCHDRRVLHDHLIHLGIAAIVALGAGYAAFTSGEPPLLNRHRRKHRRR